MTNDENDSHTHPHPHLLLPKVPHDRLEVVVEVLHDHVDLVEGGADHHLQDAHDVGVVQAEEDVGLPERRDREAFLQVVPRQLHLHFLF